MCLKTRAWCATLQKKWKIERILVLSTDLDNIAIFCRPEFKGIFMMGNSVCVKNNVVVPKNKTNTDAGAKMMYELIHVGGLAANIGPSWSAFVNLLTLAKNDFQASVHKISTDRMLRGFWHLRRQNKAIDADRLLTDRAYYARFIGACNSKLIMKRQAKIPTIAASKVDAHLKRAAWIRQYW